MRILSLTPGTGGTFYCQNCLRDGQMVRALRRQGHDVIVVPLYLPILLDAEGFTNGTGVFFGGVNVFLQQKLGIFRSTPRWLDKLFDSKWVLRQAAAREGSTRAAALGPMTYSMLQGRHGRQGKELERLLVWLKELPKPDIVHMSNALLLGMAGAIRSALNVPIVCSLQDEDTWIDAMTPTWRDRCWNIISQKANDVDAFVAVSDWYADKMALRARIPRRRIRTVPLGIEWRVGESAAAPVDPPVLGYLSRIHPTQGFSALVDAFIELKQDPRLKRLRLRATGGITSGDRGYVKDMLAKLTAQGLVDDVDIIEEFNSEARREFIESISVLSVPAPDGEAFGMFIIEAGACGVPVVQPDAGAFREVLETTGGGVIYNPTKPGGLVDSLKYILLNPQVARDFGSRARAVVNDKFSSNSMATSIAAVFEDCLTARNVPERDVAEPVKALR